MEVCKTSYLLVLAAIRKLNKVILRVQFFFPFEEKAFLISKAIYRSVRQKTIINCMDFIRHR